MSDITPDEQLERWVAGESIHMGDGESGMCCPDFSCCRPELQADKTEREAFAGASHETRHKMCFGFLGRLLSSVGRDDVYIAGEREDSGEA